MKYALDILTGARALLTPQTWTKGVFARDKNQCEVAPTSVSACRFCLDGALHAIEESSITAGLSPHMEIAMRLLDRSAAAYFPGRVIGDLGAFVNFNDNPETTIGDVHAVLDLAIEKAKVS